MNDPANDPSQVPPAPTTPQTNLADDLNQLTKDPLPTFDDEIKAFDEQHPQATPQDDPDYQVMYNQGGKFKEQLEAIAAKVGSLERSEPARNPVKEVEEVPESVELEKDKEIAGYIEKIEQEAELPHPVMDDYTNQVLLKSSQPQDVTVTLPLTADQVQTGLHHKVWEAVTWLAIWCLRQVKLAPNRVKYKQG